MAAVEAAVATAQAAHGLIPSSAADAIVAACREPVSVEVLAEGWDVGTPVLPLLDELRVRMPADAADSLHRSLTTQDVIDTAAMLLISEALRHLGELATQAAAALRAIIERSGNVATQARSFLQPADVTTVGFRTARWLDQLDQVRRRLASADDTGATRWARRRRDGHPRGRRRRGRRGARACRPDHRGTPTGHR